MQTLACARCAITFEPASKRQTMCSLDCALWHRVDKSNGCWLWTGYRRPDGYGQLRYEGVLYRTHRLAYLLTHGQIADELFVAHHCDNPPCCNPEHLFVATNDENMYDMAVKLRAGNVELNPEFVRAIRALLDEGNSVRALAHDFRVSPATISQIKRRKTWRHIT